MPRAFMYVVDRDFGFAPNPFHGACTLATCKPRIRNPARIGDWVVGMGGTRLKATGRCIFAMEVTDKVTFDEYWAAQAYRDKRPVRNGSLKMLVGDNIYHKENGEWVQADSHHSLDDGSPNPLNIRADTQSNAVLISHHFYYFGRAAPLVPDAVMSRLGYTNGRNHRTFPMADMEEFMAVLKKFPADQVLADPYDFDVASSRYTGIGSKVSIAR